LSFIFSFVARFYLFRRELHLALAIVVSLPFGFTILAIAGFTSTSPVTITTLGFIFFPFYILRLPNILQGLYMAAAKTNR